MSMVPSGGCRRGMAAVARLVLAASAAGTETVARARVCLFAAYIVHINYIVLSVH